MELRHLQTFVAVAEEEHFGRAAERLYIAQPAISKHIKDLEDELGVALFDRVGRGVRLSSAGRQFLIDTRRVLAELDHATTRVRQPRRPKPAGSRRD